MSVLTRSISKVFKGGLDSFKAFPLSMICALGFAIVTIVRIQLDWPQQESYNFLFNCLHLSFALGAIFSLMATTGARSRYGDGKSFMLTNLLSGVVVVITFLLLYFLGGMDPVWGETRYQVVSTLATARVSAAMIVSLLVFVVLAGYPKDQSDFSRSLFMTHKVLFIALLYGIVMMSGVSAVAGAIQALLYHDMSYKVYMYLGTIVGFLSFAIFLGGFPNFQKGIVDEKREIAQKQPRFIEVLLGSIMVPIMAALTVVLLLWVGKTMLSGMDVPFSQLSGIAASFALGGICLHIMLTHYESGMAKFYRRFYLIAAILILGVEAWALIIQIGKIGLQTQEYFFSLIWIFAVLAVVLLFIMKKRAHLPMVVLFCVLTIVSVMPVIGYTVLPVTSQVNRLETLLVNEGMLVDDTLVPAVAEPELKVQENITNAVEFLAYIESNKLPNWFDRDLRNYEVFKEKMGFEMVWPKPDDYVPDDGYNGISLYLPSEAIDISDYQWAIDVQNYYKGKSEEVGKGIIVNGQNGSYGVKWIYDTPDGIPILKILLDDKVILEQDMNEYVDRITKAYPKGQGEPLTANLEDMTYLLETKEFAVMIVFRYVNMFVEPKDDIIRYSFDLDAIYMNEKV